MAPKSRVAASENTSAGGPLISPSRLLRCHVLGCADHRTGDGQPAGRVADRGDAEISEEGSALFIEQDVGGLDVAMDDALAMCGGQRAEQRVGQHVDLAGRQRTVVVDLVGERPSAEVGQHEYDIVAVVDDVEQWHHVRMIESGQRRGFADGCGPAARCISWALPCRSRRLQATVRPRSSTARSTTPIPPRPSRPCTT